MSESDSDFTYESADEDSVPNTEEAKLCIEEAKLCTEEAKFCDLDASESTPTRKEVKSTEENNISETVISSTTEKICVHPKENILSLTLEELSDIPEDLCKENTGNDLNTSPVDISLTSDISVSKSGDVSLPKAEIKRVKLRLEKKLQERDNIWNSKETDSQKTEVIFKNPQHEPTVEEKPQSWGWGSWGSSLLSSAASSVSTFTSQVSQGFEAVIETVENTLGAPPPEELASSATKKEPAHDSPVHSEDNVTNVLKKDDVSHFASGTGLLGGVTSFTKALENTGAKVLMGGLNTLELIGKKTIDILTEGDPGLRKKRAVFSENINLSQVLRDAKNRAEAMSSDEVGTKEEDSVHYSTFFDEFQGLVHLEVLEMLSEQCHSKVRNLSMMLAEEVSKKNSLDEIRNICENLPSSDDISEEEMKQDFMKVISEHTDALQLSLKPEKLLQVQASVTSWLKEYSQQQTEEKYVEPKVLYSKAISSLAEFTAKSVEQFHKVAELILVQSDLPNNILQCATHLTGFASALSIEVGIMSSKFCSCLNTAADESEDPDKVTPLITSVYLEATNSTMYIQDAFQLLVPILQLAELK